MIEYGKFLSSRFDLVLRYYFFEKAGFNSKEMLSLIGSRQYYYLKDVFTKLIIIDCKDRYKRKFLKRARVFSEDSHGLHYTDTQDGSNWLWVERQMAVDSEWIKKNPYRIGSNGIPFDTKRLVLALVYKRVLYWIKMRKDAPGPFKLWEEESYEDLLGPSRFGEFKGAKDRMIRKMEELDFFSIDMYVESRKSLKKSEMSG